MSAIEVVVRKPQEPAGSSSPSSLGSSPLRGVLDLLIDGVNVTARLGEGPALVLLAEIASAVAALSRGRRDRATAPFYARGESWEVGLEADGQDVLLTVYRTAPTVSVAVHDRRIDLVTLRAALGKALTEAERVVPRSARSELSAARAGLDTPWPSFGRRPLERRTVALTTRPVDPIALECEVTLRSVPGHRETPSDVELERADLHSLLAPGSFRARSGAAVLDFGSCYPFLVAERVLLLAQETLDSWRARRPVQRRSEIGSTELRVARGPGDAGIRLTLVRLHASPDDTGSTLVAVDPFAFARAAAKFALALEARFTETDPGQRKNLRLSALARSARRVEADLDSALADDSLTNPEPESYQRFAVPSPNGARGKWEHGGKMRFIPRWVAAVPSIDLAATFQCGDRVLVGSQRQTACLDRTTGAVLWRKALPRAACVPTPQGLVRLAPNGEVTLHELERGTVSFTTHVTPRPSGGAVGALVNVPGLPRLLALAEGENAVVAIDLGSGEVRWRHRTSRPARFRLRRAGRLLLVAGGDSAIVALDAATGDVVWRVRGRLPFTGDVLCDRDSVFATAGGPIGPTELFHIDLFRGDVRFRRALDVRPAPGQPPLALGSAIVIPTADRRGAGLSGFERQTGESIWNLTPGLAAPSTAWLGVDDLAIGNSASGVVVAIDGATSRTVYARAFPRHVAADQPRRLEPVLRSGALFVPQEQVHVIRPRDGELLATLPSDLIPDLLRVDEDCNVYVAEESGHLAAFGVAPRLTLVR
jgi:outer membrane protein assembly factor BamB